MRIHKRGAAALLLALGITIGTSGVASAARPSFGTVTVMSRNLYLGTDLTPILSAASQQELVGAVAHAYGNVVASDVPGRMMAVAKEIASTTPDVAGLQEAALWGLAPMSAPADVTPTYDFLQLLVTDLAQLGHPYHVVSTTVNFSAEAPGFFPGGLQYVAFSDRDAILARDEAKIGTSNPHDGHYAYSLQLTSPTLGDVEVLRGWASIDVTVRGTSFRFVDTHLEAYSGLVAQAQAAQLASMLASYDGNVIVVGDFNSAAPAAGGTPSGAYGVMLAGGFSDAWTERPRDGSGFTCCQAGDLLNTTSQLSERIDFVFLSGPHALGMQLVGDQPSDRTASGVWPSDHAGVVADVRVP